MSKRKTKASLTVVMPKGMKYRAASLYEHITLDTKEKDRLADNGAYLSLSSNNINYPLVVIKSPDVGYLVMDTATSTLYAAKEIVGKSYLRMCCPVNQFSVTAKFKMRNGVTGHVVQDQKGNELFQQVYGNLIYKEKEKAKTKKKKSDKKERLMIPSHVYLVWAN